MRGSNLLVAVLSMFFLFTMITQFKDNYRWLSNFAPVRIMLDGIVYPSVEHAYQSAKSHEPAWKEYCSRKGVTAVDVKRASRKVKLVDNWQDVKVEVMEKCIGQKFAQSPYKEKLMATGQIHIQEGNTWKDCYWGVDLVSGRGLNMLGKMIMKVRGELIAKLVQV